MAYPPTVPPNDRANGTTTFDNHASDHNTLADAVTDVINELGSNPKGSSADLTARLASLVPPGAIFPWAGTVSSPAGYLLCNGQEVSRSTYAALFASIGTTYGVGNGSTTFNVPDTSGRFLVGIKSGTPWNNIGDAAGSADAVVVNHTHDTDLAHGHADTFAIEENGGGHGHTIVNGRAVWTQKGTGSATGMGTTPSVANVASFDETPIDNTTGTHTHNITGSVTALGATLETSSAATDGVSGTNKNMPPYLTIRYIVKT